MTTHRQPSSDTPAHSRPYGATPPHFKGESHAEKSQAITEPEATALLLLGFIAVSASKAEACQGCGWKLICHGDDCYQVEVCKSLPAPQGGYAYCSDDGQGICQTDTFCYVAGLTSRPERFSPAARSPYSSLLLPSACKS